MPSSFQYLGDPAKLLDAASYAKTLSITVHDQTDPSISYVAGVTPYDEAQLPGSVFDVQFLEDVAGGTGGGGGGGFQGTITLISVGA